MKLTDASLNQTVYITEITHNDKSARLLELGMVSGCAVCPLRNENGTMLVDVRGCRYALGKDVAECIFVNISQSLSSGG